MANADESGVDLDGMCEYLKGTPVVFALLFGSHARDAAESTADVDVALKFSEELDDRERFRTRNRIDAHLQQFADDFVDVSDIDSLPTGVAHAALRDGTVLVGDDETVDAYREQVADEYDATASEHEREHRELIDRLARETRDVDEDVLVDKLRHVNRYANDLERMRGMPEAEYLDDVESRCLLDEFVGRSDLC